MSNPLRMLAGIRVVSIEQYIGAPYCTSILSDAGAEVIKVEVPGTGDPRRLYDPMLPGERGPISGGFASYNRGKKSVELDLASEQGQAEMTTLLKSSDVLVSNLRPGALERLGLGAEFRASAFPGLVVCEISGFGQSGPYRSWPAFDSVIQAMSGLSSLIGERDGPPGLAPMATMDLLGGVYAAVGILLGLLNRQRTGRGTQIDASMYDIGAAFLERPLTLYEFTGEIPARGEDLFSPVGSFCAGGGGWVSIVIPTEEMWQRCCVAMEREDLAASPDLDDVLKRAQRMADVILPALEEWAADMTGSEAARRLRDAGQPAGVVQTIDEVRTDPHLAERGLFQPLDGLARTDDADLVLLPRLPLLFDGVGAVPGPVPTLGQNNSELLSEE